MFTFSVLCSPFLYYDHLLHPNGSNSSNYLPCRYEQKVLKTNHGSFISIDFGDGWFKRLYVSYGTCIEGFRAACRPLILLDGTFLKDLYKSTFFAATVYNGNNELFPLVFCVCDIEDEGNLH